MCGIRELEVLNYQGDNEVYLRETKRTGLENRFRDVLESSGEKHGAKGKSMGSGVEATG